MKVVDLSFKITGKEIPADHGFSLYSAISRVIPIVHNSQELGIHPISGIPIGNRLISLTDKSNLTFRIDDEKIKEILPVAGKTLDLDGHYISIGVSTVHMLIPYPRLYSRLVIIKGFMEPDAFIEAAKRQLDEMKIKGSPSLVSQEQIEQANKDCKTGTHSPFLRRTINIHNKEIVGFALRVNEFTAEESIVLQEKGLGGRRRFGCGIFIPDRRSE